jgi:hypothetical protein
VRDGTAAVLGPTAGWLLAASGLFYLNLTREIQMSYSFSVRAATKAEAMERVEKEFEQVVANQPVHAADKDVASAAAQELIGVLADDETKTVDVAVNGSIWALESGVKQVNVSISAQLSDMVQA